MKTVKSILIIYHLVEKHGNTAYYSKYHRIIDSDTGHIAGYVNKVLKKSSYKTKIIQISNFSDLKKIDFSSYDCVFNLIDSKQLESKAVKFFESNNIPFTGSSSRAIGISNNKVEAKKAFKRAKLKTPKWMLINGSKKILPDDISLEYPLIVKPAYEHCSVGINNNSVVESYTKFVRLINILRKRFKQPLLAEEYIFGREVHATLLTNNKHVHVLPLAELSFKNEERNMWNIYGFNEKWSKRMRIYKSCYFVSPPRQLSKSIQLKIQKDAKTAFIKLGFRDYGRFDIRYNPNSRKWYFIDANANAGFDPNPREAMTQSIIAANMTMEDYVLKIVKNNCR